MVLCVYDMTEKVLSAGFEIIWGSAKRRVYRAEPRTKLELAKIWKYAALFGTVNVIHPFVESRNSSNFQKSDIMIT